MRARYMTCRGAGATWSLLPVSASGRQLRLSDRRFRADVILIVKNEGRRPAPVDRFTVGADASVAGGGRREASAHTDVTMRAEMLAYSHSRGAFAGIALQGATLREDSVRIASYGSAISNRDIVTGKTVVPPAAGVDGGVGEMLTPDLKVRRSVIIANFSNSTSNTSMPLGAPGMSSLSWRGSQESRSAAFRPAP